MAGDPKFDRGVTDALRELVTEMEQVGHKARTGLLPLGTIQLSNGETAFFSLLLHRDELAILPAQFRTDDGQ